MGATSVTRSYTSIVASVLDKVRDKVRTRSTGNKLLYFYRKSGNWKGVGSGGDRYPVFDDAVPGDPNSSNEMLVRALIADGRAADRAAAKARLTAMSDAEVGAYLRGKSSAQILESYPPMPRVGMIRMPMVFREGAVLPQEEPLARLAVANGYNRVPIVVGTNRDENKLFMFGDPEWVRRLFWIFPRLRDAAGYEVTAEHMSNMWKATGADQPAATITRAGGPP